MSMLYMPLRAERIELMRLGAVNSYYFSIPVRLDCSSFVKGRHWPAGRLPKLNGPKPIRRILRTG